MHNRLVSRTLIQLSALGLLAGVACGEAATGSPVDGSPAQVTDLEVSVVSATSVTVRWTQVTDGLGSPANYAVAIGSPTITWQSALESAVLIDGSTVGEQLIHTFDALAPSTSYQVQVVAFRGTPDEPVYGPLSAVLDAQTEVQAASDPLFSDSFDSGTRTSANGFTWAGTEGVTVSSDQALSGTYSLRFRYGPDALGEDSFSEQRFNFGRNLSEVWIEYMIRLPENFVHRSDPPSNNKFVALWANVYSGVGSDVEAIVEFDRVSDTQSRARMLGLGEQYVDGGYDIRREGYHNPNLLSTSWAGEWRRVRMHWKISSGSGIDDGIWEGWIGDELMWQSNGFVFWYPGGNNFIRNGYLLGWSNSGFTEQTDFFIDDFKVYIANPGW